jgi:hypothetical protein
MSPSNSEEKTQTIPSGVLPMSWVLMAISGLVLVVAGGWVHGRLTQRWGTPLEVEMIGARLRDVPLSIGGWTSAGDQDMSPSTVTLLECIGYLKRAYVNQSTGETVSVAVMFGPKGPIAVHTPEVCYSSQDVTASERRRPVTVDYDGTDSRIWQLGFVSNDLEKSKLDVMYGWSDGGPWYAAESPRFWRADYLYKLQTAASVSRGNKETTQEFLRVFLPELRKVMKP